MSKIKNISIGDNCVNMELNDGYVVDIPINDSYSKNMFLHAYKDTSNNIKDIRYYDKCADICIYPIWLSLAILLAGYITKFPVMELFFLGCGAMTGVSLVGLGTFKLASKKLKDKVCNNKYWNELYNYATGNSKHKSKTNDNNKKYTSSKVNKSSEYSRKKNQIIQDQPTISSNNYHLRSNEIIQDEVVHKKR